MLKQMSTIILLSFTLAACSLGDNSGKIDTSKLVLVDENHANLIKNNVTYVLDSYIVPFQQPYYVTIKRNDNKIIPLKDAERIAAEYIKTRGCTTPVKRRSDLDKSNQSKTQWLIGIEC